MRFLLFLLILCSQPFYSQETIQYYLDSKPIDISKTFLDPANIKEVKARKKIDAVKPARADEIHITRKNPESLILTIAEFASQIKSRSEQLRDADGFTIVIDGKLIEEWDSYSIETSCLAEVLIITEQGSGPFDVKPSVVLKTNSYKPGQ